MERTQQTDRRTPARVGIAAACLLAIALTAGYAVAALPGRQDQADSSDPVRAKGLRITLSPSEVTITAGNSATVRVCVSSGPGRRVRLRVRSPLPAEVTASFDPRRVVRGACSTLTIATASTAPGASSTVTIRARQPRHRRVYRASATMSLVLSRPTTPPPTPPPTATPPPVPATFGVAGDAAWALMPGGSAAPIDLRFTNDSTTTIHVTAVTVSVTGTTTGAACGPANFTTTSFTYGSLGTRGVAVAPGQTVSLSAAGVPLAAWPTVAMLSAGDQDACQGAGVSLAYTDGVAYS